MTKWWEYFHPEKGNFNVVPFIKHRLFLYQLQRKKWLNATKVNQQMGREVSVWLWIRYQVHVMPKLNKNMQWQQWHFSDLETGVCYATHYSVSLQIRKRVNTHSHRLLLLDFTDRLANEIKTWSEYTWHHISAVYTLLFGCVVVCWGTLRHFKRVIWSKPPGEI